MKMTEKIAELEREVRRLEQEAEGLRDDLRRKMEHIAWLERQLFGSRRDRSKRRHAGTPSMFDEEFNEAYDARQSALKEAEKKVSATAEARRGEAKERARGSRPEKCRYSGLEERERTVLPEGVDIDEYEQIGDDITRVLRHGHADPDAVRSERERLALPILDGIEAMFAPAAAQCTPADPLGKALDYANKMWPRIRRYALDGRYQIDNNAVERSQRPTVMGRKNFLFSKNDRGAEDNAVFYTLLETCSVVGVTPLKWLNFALERIRPDMDEDRLALLLPYNCKAEL